MLVTGPTGSGKSTTLAAMVNHINENEHGHILTIEDPIEFVHESKKCLINQREVGPHTLSFSNALRSALREDPDVILVGEMRDLETIRLALTARGDRPPGVRHAAHLVGRQDHRPHRRRVPGGGKGDGARDAVGVAPRGDLADAAARPRTARAACAAHEIMIGTPAIRNLIRENKIAQMYSAIQTGRQIGMQTLDQNLQELVQRNIDLVGRGARQGRQQRQLRGVSEHAWNANRQPSSSTTCCARWSRKKGSDLFITAGFPPAMKVDGKMTPVSQQALTAAAHRDAVRAR